MRKWLEQQKIFIPLKGYHKSFNPEKNYNVAKEPIRKWQDINNRYLLSELENHFRSGGWIGMVLPPNIVVVDVDRKQNDDEAEEKVRKLVGAFGIPYARTPNGYHLFFLLNEPMAQTIARPTPVGLIVDYRVGGKGYIVYPLSGTPDREWIRDEGEEVPLPFLLYPLATQKPPDLPVEITEGSRHGTLLHVYHQIYAGLKDQYKDATQMFDQIAHHINEIFCEPPQDISDVNRLIHDVINYQGTRQDTMVANLTTKFILDKQDRLYYYSDESYHYVPLVYGTSKLLKFASKYLQDKVSDSKVKLLYNQAKVIAEYHDIWRTVYYDETDLYVDLNQEILHATKEMAETIPTNQTQHYFVEEAFIEYEYDPAFNPIDFLTSLFSNVDKRHIPALYAYILCRLLEAPTPALLFEGAYGSGKTTIARLLSYIIQGYDIQISPQHLLKDDVPLILKSNKTVIIDNITYINIDQSNFLCEAITGGQLTKRKLYSDDTLLSYKMYAGFIFTAVKLDNLLPDLISRTVPIVLSPINKRNNESYLMKQIDIMRKKLNYCLVNDIVSIFQLWNDNYASSFRFPMFEFAVRYIAEKYQAEHFTLDDIQDLLWFKQSINVENLQTILEQKWILSHKVFNHWLGMNEVRLKDWGFSWNKIRKSMPDGSRPYIWVFSISDEKADVVKAKLKVFVGDSYEQEQD